MARVLAISSQVARGHVGLSAIVPALQALGHEVIALPTILLSNHPGHDAVAGDQVAPELLRRMLDALDANGWLGEVDAVMTGYLPSVAHVRFASEAVGRVRKETGGTRVLVDPVLGDDVKGLYIDADAAVALRDELIGSAHVTTPNAFELGWLTGGTVGHAEDAVRFAAKLEAGAVIVTSVPAGGDGLDNVLALRGSSAVVCRVPRRSAVPNGTGDLLAALHLGHELTLGPERASDALALAVSGVDAAIAASQGRDELCLVQRDMWARPTPLPIAAL